MDIIHELLLSSIISISKDMKSSLRDSNNYRGISLLMQFVKCMTMQVYNFLICILVLKANHSTVMCSLVFPEIINHY